MTDDAKTIDPHTEYRRRLELHEAELTTHTRWERILSNLRLATFLAGLVVGWLAFGSHTIEAGWAILPVLLFVALLVVHDRIIQKRRRAQRAVDFYGAGLARLEDRWMGTGETGLEYRDPHHPYADDIDLFGSGSLFELLCTARTTAGQATLARWLKQQADVREVQARQAAVEELTHHLALREDLALLGEEVQSRLDPEALIRWGVAPSVVGKRTGLRIAAAFFSSLSVLGLVAWLLLGAGPFPFLIALAPQLVFASATKSRIKPVIDGLEQPTRDLALLRDLLARLEEETMSAPRLVALRDALSTHGLPPSRSIAKLRRIADLLDARRNQFFAPIAGLLLWGTQLALLAEHWREQWGHDLASWIEAAGEIEALAALSAYAYENPSHVMPMIVAGPPSLDGQALGHPLLPRERCTRNDIQLGEARRALIISGSNMSGKSTYLRTVACNVLLALAGAPVRAQRFRLTPIAIAAAIRVSDSLQEGASQFYAEIKRLRQVVELCDGELPVLFLLDEILHGTNSHDRRIGASAVVKGLIERGALGLVTTHDLALAKIADEMGDAIENVHFEDHLEDGRMVFDYQLRPGVVEKSNALELMRAVGLEV